MKNISGLWVLYFVVGTVLMSLDFSCSTRSLSFPDVVSSDDGGSMRIAATGRKLTEYGNYPSDIDKNSNGQKVILEDYHLVDPPPSSKSSLNPGPVDHGTPLIPYIPKQPPPPAAAAAAAAAAAPDHPRIGGSPVP